MGHCHWRSRHCACSLWCVAVVGDVQRGMGEAPQGGVVEEGAKGLVHLPAVSHEKRAGEDTEITPRVLLSHHAPFCPVPPLQRPHPPLSSHLPQHHGLAQHCSTTTLQHPRMLPRQRSPFPSPQHHGRHELVLPGVPQGVHGRQASGPAAQRVQRRGVSKVASEREGGGEPERGRGGGAGGGSRD